LLCILLNYFFKLQEILQLVYKHAQAGRLNLACAYDYVISLRAWFKGRSYELCSTRARAKLRSSIRTIIWITSDLIITFRKKRIKVIPQFCIAHFYCAHLITYNFIHCTYRLKQNIISRQFYVTSKHLWLHSCKELR
jgi:hypothetical protein